MNKWNKFLALILLLGLISACGGKPERPAPILTQQQIDAANARAAVQSTAPASGGLVQHYACPNNCAGSGGGAAGTCPVCGTAYVHNQAWHDQQGATTPPGATAGTTTPPAITPPVNQTPEPPQNASGVWHYTCTSGCAGGAGSATACATCGSTLVHNTAYHN